MKQYRKNCKKSKSERMKAAVSRADFWSQLRFIYPGWRRPGNQNYFFYWYRTLCTSRAENLWGNPYANRLNQNDINVMKQRAISFVYKHTHICAKYLNSDAKLNFQGGRLGETINWNPRFVSMFYQQFPDLKLPGPNTQLPCRYSALFKALVGEMTSLCRCSTLFDKKDKKIKSLYRGICDKECDTEDD